MKFRSRAIALGCATALALPTATAAAETPLEVFREALVLVNDSHQYAWRVGGVTVINPAMDAVVKWDLRQGNAQVVDQRTGLSVIVVAEGLVLLPIPETTSKLNQRALTFLNAPDAGHLQARLSNQTGVWASYLALASLPSANPFLANAGNSTPSSAQRIVDSNQTVRYAFTYDHPLHVGLGPTDQNAPRDRSVEIEFREGILTRIVAVDSGTRTMTEYEYRPVSVSIPAPGTWVRERDLFHARQWLAGPRDTKRMATKIARRATERMARGLAPIAAIRQLHYPQDCRRINCTKKTVSGGVKVRAWSKFGTSWATVTWHERKNKIVIRSGQRQNLANAPQLGDTATTAAAASAESQPTTMKGGSS